jgi:hypothetical protein
MSPIKTGLVTGLLIVGGATAWVSGEPRSAARGSSGDTSQVITKLGSYSFDRGSFTVNMSLEETRFSCEARSVSAQATASFPADWRLSPGWFVWVDMGEPKSELNLWAFNGLDRGAMPGSTARLPGEVLERLPTRVRSQCR